NPGLRAPGDPRWPPIGAGGSASPSDPGGAVVTLEASPWSWDPDRLSLVLETAARFFESHLADRHREHLRARYGLTDETIARGRIGFAPVDRSALIVALMGAGLDREEIKA